MTNRQPKRRAALLRSAVALGVLLAAAPQAFAQEPGAPVGGGGQPGAAQPGQGGLSPDTPVLVPGGPKVNGGPADGAGAALPPKPKTPLPPRDTPRDPQPGQSADGPKTPLPPRDTPRAKQPGGDRRVADPNWPCPQVKVSELSWGQMWSGPSLEQALKTWDSDKDVSALVDTLVARRTPMDEARELIDKFAQSAGDKKDKELTLLFAGVFSEINGQRSQIMSGIGRFTEKQRALADKIKAESLEIADTQKDMASQITPEATQKQQALDWDTRIYDERSHQLNYVCESPVILEQRAFDLGREIQSRLSQSGQ